MVIKDIRYIEIKNKTFPCIVIIITIVSASVYYGSGTMLSILHVPPQLCKKHIILPTFHMGELSSEKLTKLLRITSF